MPLAFALNCEPFMQKSIYTPAYAVLLSELVALRKSRKVTQRKLAADLGVSHSWVAKVEIGERRVDVIEMLRLIRTLDGDPHKILQAVNESLVERITPVRSPPQTMPPPVKKRPSEESSSSEKG